DDEGVFPRPRGETAPADPRDSLRKLEPRQAESGPRRAALRDPGGAPQAAPGAGARVWGAPHGRRSPPSAGLDALEVALLADLRLVPLRPSGRRLRRSPRQGALGPRGAGGRAARATAGAGLELRRLGEGTRARSAVAERMADLPALRGAQGR